MGRAELLAASEAGVSKTKLALTWGTSYGLLTVAGTAIQNTMPGGVVLTTAFVFRRYRRYGADG